MSENFRYLHAMLAVFCWLSLLAMSADNALAQSENNWPRFRGPNGSGVAQTAKLPTDWKADDYDWKVKLEGTGASSPVVWNQRLFVSSCNSQSGELLLNCFDCESGESIWRRSIQGERYRMHDLNSLASSTPAVDDRHVYFSYAMPEHTVLMALDHDGEEVWKRDFGTWVSQHGFGTSPVVVGDRVILVSSQQAEQLRGGQEPGESQIVAVHRLTGDDLWRTSLKTDRACYSVPCVFQSNDRSHLIGCSLGEGFYAVDPDDGTLQTSNAVFQMRTVASPVVNQNFVYGSNGSGGGGNYLVANQFVEGQFKPAFEIRRNANYVSTPIVVNGLLFMFGDKGIATCADAQTGETYWRQRLSSRFIGSPVANATHLYIVDSEGKVLVIKADSEFEVVHTIELGEASRSTPAISGHRIFFRTESQVFTLGGAP